MSQPSRLLSLLPSESPAAAKPTHWSRITQESLPPHLANNSYFCQEQTLFQLVSPDPNFSLSQAICSYGYFCLAPNRWVPSPNDQNDDEGILLRPLWCGEVVTLVAIGQDSTIGRKPQNRLIVSVNHLNHNHHHIHHNMDYYTDHLLPQVVRMTRIDQTLNDFYALHPEAKTRGFGRLYRSPTLFEDMIKTITNCNMKWSGTVAMNAKLCHCVGTQGAFPTPAEIYHTTTPESLKEHCRLGYRSPWVWNLAQQVCTGALDLSELEQLEDPVEIQTRLKQLPGIGEFASNNLLHLMGHFESFPYDTETVRLWKEEFGATKSMTKAQIFAKAKAHYAPYEPFQFIAYWFDLWKNYERRSGSKSTRWSIEQLESERPANQESDHNSVFVISNSSAKATSTDKKQKKTTPRKRKRPVAVAVTPEKLWAETSIN